MKKKVILDLIKKNNKQYSAEELYNILSKNMDINLSTIYRALNDYTNKGILKKVVRQNKIAYYELNDKKNEYYLICDKCQKTYELNDDNMKQIIEKISDKSDFDILDYSFELHGICKNCKK